MPIKLAPSFNKMFIQNLELKQENYSLKTKATEYDKYVSSESTYPIKIVANNYGLKPAQVNYILEAEGVQYKDHSHWYLTQKYVNHGLAKIVPFTIKDKNFTVYHMRWTNRGLIFISKILEKHGYPQKGVQVY